MARLTKPVSQALQNAPGDARYVQFLLNDWRREKGLATLAEDGIVGPLTNTAIRDFQKAETGIVDGRVDVNGPTIRMLEYLHIVRLAGQVYTPILQHYAICSKTRPPLGPVTMSRQAGQYLTAIRKSQDYRPKKELTLRQEARERRIAPDVKPFVETLQVRSPVR
jgi:hypothetical protein